MGRYIPNLVAVPFEMTKEFAAKILEVVPSERIKAALDDPKVWDSYAETTRSSAVCCSPNC